MPVARGARLLTLVRLAASACDGKDGLEEVEIIDEVEVLLRRWVTAASGLVVWFGENVHGRRVNENVGF